MMERKELPMQVAVEGIVDTLRQVPPARFQPGEVCARLRGLLLDPATLQRYLHFSPRRYTRNLIYRDEIFELVALCWEPRTQSPIHNHSGQLCWLSIQRGVLRLENFKSLDGPGPGDGIRLVPNGGIPRAPEGVLDLQQGENGIHRVSNPFDERAVSLHVYSRPYDTCIAYDPVARTAREMRLQYHSVGGELVDGPPEQMQ
jgi:cysteine dioxygenase